MFATTALPTLRSLHAVFDKLRTEGVSALEWRITRNEQGRTLGSIAVVSRTFVTRSAEVSIQTMKLQPFAKREWLPTREALEAMMHLLVSTFDVHL